VIKKIALVVLLCLPLQACGMHARAVKTTQEFYSKLTPPEYYGNVKTVATESDQRVPETKEDRMNVALIGTLAGLVAVAGVVVPLVLLK